ncbi:RNA-directed DNA polymerase, eukaryota [Tanacetum coccineum]|uniref:RNA-directed DNA polymerase, eukaryota n=1 Tax=Tanacetum coccineum TaxID=301880 RepID=A0ABQ4Z6F0_9ASTR
MKFEGLLLFTDPLNAVSSKEDTAYQRLDFTRKRAYSIPNTAYPTTEPTYAVSSLDKQSKILTSSKAKSTKTYDGLAAIQAQLNNLGRKIKKVNKKVYAAQFRAPYQPGGQYRAAGPGLYQCNNINSSYPDQRQTLEESLTKFMAESAKRHEENSNIIKEIRASTDAAIRNQGASIKTLEIQIGQMSKVLQERGMEDLFHTPKAHDVKILEAYDHTLPQKEKDLGSFTLPCFIHNVCFDKAIVDLGASVSVMPFCTYTNLDLGILSHTRLTIELADKTIKQPRGIAKNVLVRIGKFIFPIDFIILDIPEDDDVPLILGLPFLSTTHSKIDVYKRKFILRDKDDHEGKSPAGALIDIRVFVGKFSILTGFIIIDDEDVTRDVALGMPFFMKYVSCQMIMKKFAHGDKCERIMDK